MAIPAPNLNPPFNIVRLSHTELRVTDLAWSRGYYVDTLGLQVTHEDAVVSDIILTHNQSADHWTLSVPIPPEAIADGVQTLIIRDADTDAKIGHITLIAGEVLSDDIRAEMDLLRAELDMLKRAFRRHCLETT